MGCGDSKEKIVNEMIALKLERVGVQMERKNQIKLLEEIDGNKIKEPTIPDYLVLEPKEKNNKKSINKKSNKKIPIIIKKLDKNSQNRMRSKSVNVKNKIKNLKTNITTALDFKRINKSKSKKSLKNLAK